MEKSRRRSFFNEGGRRSSRENIHHPPVGPPRHVKTRQDMAKRLIAMSVGQGRGPHHKSRTPRGCTHLPFPFGIKKRQPFLNSAEGSDGNGGKHGDCPPWLGHSEIAGGSKSTPPTLRKLSKN
ncbi:hypothetical protein NPIL_406011 [Nephila pilipes]|uniref:Uncharacterized protein n=1 Tax=Nephila pilipes TaxID=299642 RepID=A0A8X6Q112_NEPPI|nr:hypothetical protein NPIL_406011 [Nephila pilipes]